MLVAEVLDTPYLVGSCMTRPDYRDIDIRVILDDERFDALFPHHPHRDALRHLVQVSLTEHYVRSTGLERIDFQILRTAPHLPSGGWGVFVVETAQTAARR